MQMKQIQKANAALVGILGKGKQGAEKYRMLRYCVSKEVDEGVLLFNLLTRELLLLTEEEFAGALEQPYLRKQWFVVPEETDEKKLVASVRWVQAAMTKTSDGYDAYTILTTTDCNARCFYCYELGRSRIPMSKETAEKTAQFIIANSGGNSVRLRWFGGEPLYNYEVIDLISERLHQAGVSFKSTMISNAYLFEEELAEKAATLWNLQRVQITLDGTEPVYNRCKAFIYRDGSPYQVVLANIERLLNRGIGVSVRMNMDFHNAEDLLNLADELAQRFAGQKKLSAYSHLIFDEKKSWDQRYSLEKWEELYAAWHRLEDRLEELGLGNARHLRVKRKLPQYHCMADNPDAVMILPDGNLGKCEHFTENEFIGNLDSSDRDQAVIEKFRKRCAEIPECETCFYYPECIRPAQCTGLNPCIPPERASLYRGLQKAMVNDYNRWKDKDTSDEEEVDELC